MVHSPVHAAGMRIPPPAPARVSAGRGFAMMLMIVSSLIISFGGLIARSMAEADPHQINFYRSIALSVTFTLVFVANHKARAVRNFRKTGLGCVVAGGCLTVAGLAFMQALAHTTVANTMFTLAAIPFITAGLARVFLRERLGTLTLVTMVVASAGVAMMVANGVGAGSVYGNLMALVTALGFSGFAVVVRRNRHVDMLPALIVSGVFVMLISLALSYDDLSIPWRDVGLCVLWGTLVSGLGNCLFIIASRYLVAGELTLFMLLEFALAPFWVWLFIRETPTAWALAGGVLVILAVAVRALLEMKGKADPSKRGHSTR